MDKKNMFDFLENSDEGELGMIDRLTPDFSEEQFERILEMSKRKRNIIKTAKESKNINISTNNDEVMGVESYSRPAWTRMFAVAASLVLLGGGLALAHNFMKRSKPETPIVVPDIAATTVVTTTVTTDSEDADITTVSADVTATGTGSAVTESETTSETTAQTTVSSAPATTVQTTEQVMSFVDKYGYTEEMARQCVDVINDLNYKKMIAEELLLPISDYLDMSDTFTINVHEDWIEPGLHGETRTPVDTQYMYAHYVNPMFSTRKEMEEYCIENYFKEMLYDEWTDDLDITSTGFTIKRIFRYDVYPDMEFSRNAYDKLDNVPLYAEYDGKIYQAIRSTPITREQYRSEFNPGMFNTFVVDNCEEDRFLVYDFIFYDTFPSEGRLITVTKENGIWRVHDGNEWSRYVPHDELEEIMATSVLEEHIRK